MKLQNIDCVVNKNVTVVALWDKYTQKYYDIIGVLDGYKSGGNE